MKDRLGLTTITRLLPVITSLTLHIETVLALFVLCHLVKCMLLAVLAFTKGLLGLGNVHHDEEERPKVRTRTHTHTIGARDERERERCRRKTSLYRFRVWHAVDWRRCLGEEERVSTTKP
jgi:hypothetical protein